MIAIAGARRLIEQITAELADVDERRRAELANVVPEIAHAELAANREGGAAGGRRCATVSALLW